MGQQRDEMTLTGTGPISYLPYGFVPVEIYYEKSNLPPLTIVEGDYQTRGYQVTFFNSAGDEIVHTDTQFARCYAVNPKVSGDSYYTEGRYQDGHWYLWVPSKTLTVAGTVQIQIILYEGNEQLIHTRVCKVRISPSIAQNAIANPDDGGTGESTGGLSQADLAAIQKMIKVMLSGKADKAHAHDERYYSKDDLDNWLGNTVSFGTYTLRQSEIDNMLLNKADTGHTHDDRYYTESEIDTKLATHTHSQYQTQGQVNAQIDQKFVLCTSLDDAKSKQSSGSYPVGTIFLIKKEG